MTKRPEDESSFHLDTEVAWEMERAVRRGTIPPHDAVRPRAPKERPAPPPSTAATSLWSALLAEDDLDRAWDHEFTASPHSPAPMRQEIAALGAVALPELLYHLDDPYERARLQALATLGGMGATARPALAAIARHASSDAELERAYAVAAFCSIDFDAVREYGLHLTPRACTAVVQWINQHVGRQKRRRQAAQLIDDRPEQNLVALEVFEQFPLIAPIERIVELAHGSDPRVRGENR